LLQRPR